MNDRTAPPSAPREPIVALLPWGNVIEDFLDTVGLSFEEFRDRMSGGWLFGYIEALRYAGIRTVLICFSARITSEIRCRHRPTGAAIRVLRAPLVYRAARYPMTNPYGISLEEVYGRGEGSRLRGRLARSLLRDVAPYLATPVMALARTLRRERCSAILCQEYENPRFDICVALGRLLHLPVFATFQGGDWQSSRIESRARPIAIRRCAGLIIGPRSESRRVRDLYGVPAQRIARIFNPIDLSLWSAVDRTAARAELGIPDAARVLVWHGRVDMHRKGLDVLVRAWAGVTARRPSADLRLLLIGAGSGAEELRTLITSLDVHGVTWRNEYVLDRPVMRRYLSAADAYVLPSRHEGFPVAPIEAMACGLPVVAADAPGVRDILEGGDAPAGVVVPRGDAAALGDAIARVLDNDALRHEMARHARRRAEASFSLDTVGDQLRDFMTARGLPLRSSASPAH